jgi:hypothetical protein
VFLAILTFSFFLFFANERKKNQLFNFLRRETAAASRLGAFPTTLEFTTTTPAL